MTRTQTFEGDGAPATMRMRKTACLIAAREKQMARLQDEFRKLLILSAEITVDGQDLPDIVETIDEPLDNLQSGDRVRHVRYKWAALIAATAVLALVFIPFPLSVSGLGNVVPARSIATEAASGESLAISVKPGMPATLCFESLPDRAFRGTVESVGGLSSNELQNGSRAAQPQGTSHIAPLNTGVVYVGIRLNERLPDSAHDMDASAHLCYSGSSSSSG